MIKTKPEVFIVFLFFYLFICDGCQRKCENDYTLRTVATAHEFTGKIWNKQGKPLRSDSIPFKKGDTVTFEILTEMRDKNRTSCYHSRYMPESFGNKIKIETIGDFDSTHRGGSNITHFFRVSGMNYWGYYHTYSCDSFGQTYPGGFSLKLIKKPDFPNFKLKLTNFNDNSSKVLTCTSPQLKFILK